MKELGFIYHVCWSDFRPLCSGLLGELTIRACCVHWLWSLDRDAAVFEEITWLFVNCRMERRNLKRKLRGFAKVKKGIWAFLRRSRTLPCKRWGLIDLSFLCSFEIASFVFYCANHTYKSSNYSCVVFFRTWQQKLARLELGNRRKSEEISVVRNEFFCEVLCCWILSELASHEVVCFFPSLIVVCHFSEAGIFVASWAHGADRQSGVHHRSLRPSVKPSPALIVPHGLRCVLPCTSYRTSLSHE